MRKKVIFITGASGEVGHALIRRLSEDEGNQLVTLDLHPLPPDLEGRVMPHVVGDLLGTTLLTRLISQYEIDSIFHLLHLCTTCMEFPFQFETQ